MSKLINEVGHKYGDLVVIKRGPNNKNGRAQWICQCKCGKEALVLGTYLRRGETKSCGCGKFSPRVKDEINHIYGSWQVLQRAPNGKNDNEAYWLCKCLNCGTISSVLGTNLRTGKSQSCGCQKSKGEQLITSILQELNYNFKKELTFPDLHSPFSNNFLRFDFGIYNNKNELLFLIEYQGIHHEKNIEYFGNNLEEVLIRDKAKREYCAKKDIPLICYTPVKGKLPQRDALKEMIQNDYEEYSHEISN